MARPAPITSMLLLLAGWALAGCAQDPVRPSTDPAEHASPLVEESDSPFVAFSAIERAAGREVLDIAADGRMVVGTQVPVPPRSSARLRYEARYVDADGHESALPGVDRVQDVRFAYPPSPLVALLDDRDVLTVWNTATGAVLRVDDQVFVGFGFDHAGKSIVYAKGQTPELEAYRAELPVGTPRQLTSGGVPVWGFAFSPDDTTIVYVDAPDGFPCLMTMRADGSDRARLTNRTLSPSDVMVGKRVAPYPDGRRPPLWVGETVYVQDAAGVHGIDRLGRVVFHHAGGRDLHLGISGRAAMYRDGTSIRGTRR